MEDNNKTPDQKAVETKGDHWRDFWLCETGMGQQGAQLHDCQMMMIFNTKTLLHRQRLFTY